MRVVVIAGVGLIGGSFALALRKAGFDGRIVGVGSERTIQEALALGVIDQGAPLHEAAPRADLLILSHTISRILETIPILDELVKPGCLITDAGSTKGAIVDCARKHVRRAQFLGGHPMAGSEARGVGAASADLFRGRTWVLTPGNAEELATPAANEFRHWLSAIGAVEMILAPDEHDRVVALTSHLPQLASTALAETVAAGSSFGFVTGQNSTAFLSVSLNKRTSR